jgi:hypothetical protein
MGMDSRASSAEDSAICWPWFASRHLIVATGGSRIGWSCQHGWLDVEMLSLHVLARRI